MKIRTSVKPPHSEAKPQNDQTDFAARLDYYLKRP